MTTHAVTSTHPLPGWLSAARARHRIHERGSVGLIDAEAMLRGVRAVTNGTAVPIGRRLAGSAGPNPPFSLEVWTHQAGIYTSAYDRVRVECHGTEITHIDALNHFGLFSSFYGTSQTAPADGVDIGALARHPIVTRAVFLDLVEDIEADHVDVGRPVGGPLLRRALERAAVDLLPGDALLLYMGRDRFEATGGVVAPVAESPDGRPGIGDDGARWLSEQPVGAVGWDLLDAHPHEEIGFPVHALSWALGLVLIDNCAFGELRDVMASREPRTGLLVVSPLAIDGGTGCAVNPVVIV
jgi:kynurenine formamidase